RVFALPKEERGRGRLQLRGNRVAGHAIVGDLHVHRTEGCIGRRLHVDLRGADIFHVSWLSVDLNADAVELRRQLAVHHFTGTPRAATVGELRSLNRHPRAGAYARLEA